MKIKGSSKRRISLLFPVIFAFALSKSEAIYVFGNQVILYMIIFIIIIGIIESIFDRREIISHDQKILSLDLSKCLVEINIKDIKSLHLKGSVTDLIIETNEATHIYKLYGFGRKKIQMFIESITTTKNDIL